MLPATASGAQRPLNLDFEIPPSDYRWTQPWGWSELGDGVEATLDSVDPKQGRRALRLRTGGNAVATSIAHSLTFARGKRVRFAGWIRTDGLQGGRAGLRVRALLLRDVLAADSTAADGASGSSPWTRYEVILNIDTAATRVELSLTQSGTGTAWFDALELEVEGSVYAAVPSTLPPVTDADVAWVRARATPVSTTEPGRGFDDLRPLAAKLSGATIVGLGEGTHGTSEFFTMKHRMLEFLVQEMGFTIFALEQNQLEAERIGAYVRGGDGDATAAAALVAELYPPWRTREVVRLVEWIREHNRRVPPAKRVQFVGVDMQDPRLPIESVVAFLARVDPSFASEAAAAYRGLREREEEFVRAGRAALPPRSYETMLQWQTDAARVLAHVRGNRSTYEAQAGRAATAWTEQHANVVYQAASRNVARTSFYRDSAMAANLDWILAQNLGAKAVTWAHNLHVSREQGQMGLYLSRSHPGGGYLNFGFSTYEGEYTGRLTPRPGWHTKRAFPAPPGTIEEALHRTGLPRFILDLRAARVEAGGAWLRATPGVPDREFRNIGAENVDYGFYPAPILTYFDFLIHVDRTTASALLSRSAGEVR